jgi:hypothetical protein
VYNFTVERDHVYYVGDLSTLTHNNCPMHGINVNGKPVPGYGPKSSPGGTPGGSAAIDQHDSIQDAQRRLRAGDQEQPRSIDDITKSERRLKNELNKPYDPSDWE